MKNSTIAALVAATMIAMAMAPVGMAVPTKNCDGTLPPPGVDPQPCATIAGPASFDFKGVLGVGVGFCVEEDGSPGVPLDCDNTPGTISGAGAYVHDTSACTGPVGCFYDVWVEQVGGVFVSGWGFTVCTDRDDGSDICTNVGPGNIYDDFGEGFKGEELTGADKEKKHPDWAHTTFCARYDNFDNHLDGVWDNFFVFISAWIDEDQGFTNKNDNTGHGISVGQYDVYVEFVATTSDQDACESVLTIVGSRTPVGP